MKRSFTGFNVRIFFALTVLVMLFSAALTTTAYADALADDDVDTTDSPHAPTISVTAGEREVGAYWQDYKDSSEGDLPNAKNNVEGFYNTLRYHPWTIFGKARWCQFSGHDCYKWSNANVFEDDFVDNDNNWVDDVDLVFYEGHGWSGGFTVRPPDDHYVQYGEVQGRWGDKDLEYMFLLSCSVLSDSTEANWFGAFDGLHLLGGFANTAYDVKGFGTKFATNIVWGYNYKDSWFKACDSHQPSGVTAKILAEVQANYYETAYVTNADPTHNGTYWWWKKACGAPTSSTLSPSQLADNFPVFETPALSLDESERTFGNLTNAFGFDTVKASAATTQIDNTQIISDTEGRTLEMDVETGMWYYIDPNRTFSTTVSSRVSAAGILADDDAKRIADAFLAQNGLMPGDSVFNTVEPVVLAEVLEGTGVAAAQVLQSETTTLEVIYSRYIPYEVQRVNAASGLMETETISVPIDGPGAKLKVYVTPTGGDISAASAAAEAGAVVGAQGGWRRINEVQASALRATVPILDYEKQILPLFNELETEVAYTMVPFSNPTKKTVLEYNLSAYEDSISASAGQALLYPAYRLLVRYEGEPAQTEGGAIGETVVFTDYTWIPANSTFVRPLAMIESTSDVSKSLPPGSEVTAKAVDAATTLKDAGFNSALDFKLGVGAYSYEWFLNDATAENKIGSGLEVSFMLPERPENAKNGYVTYKVILQVTDLGQDSTALATNTASFNVTTGAPLYLPFLTKN